MGMVVRGVSAEGAYEDMCMFDHIAWVVATSEMGVVLASHRA